MPGEAPAPFSAGRGEQIQQEARQIAKAVGGTESLAYGTELHTGLGDGAKQRVHLPDLDPQGLEWLLGRRASGAGGPRRRSRVRGPKDAS
jgi:hypothetical protein